MTTPSPYVVDHDETFCIFSLRIIQLVKALIIVEAVCNLYTASVLLISPAVYRPERFINCQDDQNQMIIVEKLIAFVPDVLCDLAIKFIFFSQIAE